MEMEQVHQMKRAEVVIIATPTIGNLVPAVEFATHLINHHPNRISVTILDISMPEWPLIHDYIQSHTSTQHIRFIKLNPPNSQPTPHQHDSVIELLSLHLENHKHVVKETLKNIPIVGLFIDMFCTSMIDVANELNIPCYMFFASPVAYLSFVLHLTTLVAEPDSSTELTVPGFTNLVPPNAFPFYCIDKDELGYSRFISHTLRYKETQGIAVNTFQELEPYPLESLCSSNIPTVYPVGPIIDHVGPAKWHENRSAHEKIIQWLNQQPESSVVFLCFGSMGSMNRVQVKELGTGLEKCGYRFLWTIREPPKGKLETPNDYHDFDDDLFPNGFVDRTAERGLVCGWVSQVSVLAHKAIGGFMSHCGWNSILESIWHGVPIATWPLYAEQHLNAFEMVKELGLSMEIRLDDNLVLADDVERGVRKLMDDSELRKKVKEMSEKCKKTLMKNGSSYQALDDLVNDILSHV